MVDAQPLRRRPPAIVLVLGLLVGTLLMPQPAVAEAGQAEAAGTLPLGGVTGVVSSSSTPIGCERSNQLLEITADSHLDPGCTWTRGFRVTGSDVTLDCRGASVASPGGGGTGISIQSPTDVPLRGVTVRNCLLSGFLNNVKITRLGFRTLTPETGYEPDEVFSDVIVENSVSADSIGVGIFVDGFVTGVTLRDLEVMRAGSVGIYLETDSRGTTVTRSHVHTNGHRENGPAGTLWSVGGLQVWFWGTGREGIAVDGSSFNHIVGNVIEDNVAGGIFLYKNCGEFPDRNPGRWWPRFQGSHENVIQHNIIRREQHGVWVGSRMAENQYFMECTDDAYGEAQGIRYHEDHADRNVVDGNEFVDVQYGVRVEDDQTRVVANRFRGASPDALAVVVGTAVRAQLLGRPVIGTSVVGNQADLDGIAHPYRWIPDQAGSVFADNRSGGRLVGWCEGVQPTINPALFVVLFAIPPPEDRAPLPPAAPVEQPDCPAGTDPAPPVDAAVDPTPSTSPAAGGDAPTEGAGLSAASPGEIRPAAPSPAASGQVVTPAFTG